MINHIRFYFALSIVILMSPCILAQQTDNWYFGSASGFPNTGLRVSFTSGSPVVTTGYPISTEEGSSSISDANGNPLFFTDGTRIWDASTNVAFGTGLNGGQSSTQSAVVMPRPGFTNQWLLFTSGDNGTPGLTCYTVTGTLGSFSISAGTTLNAAGLAGEGLCIVGNSAVAGAFWVITRDIYRTIPSISGVPGQVRAFAVSNTGIVSTTPILSSLSGTSFTNTVYGSTIGTIKANTCQNKLAFTYLNGDVDIVDFDAATGRVVTNTARRINVASTGGNSGSYGIEFSPNDAYLYITNLSSGNLYRYNVAANSVAAFGNVAAGNEAGQLQVGPDGNIYLANRNASPATAPNYLGIISSPGLAGATFIPQAVLLSGVVNGSGNFGFVYRGLPTFPKALIVASVQINPSSTNICTGTPTNVSYQFAGFAAAQTWTVNPSSGWTFSLGNATSTSPTIIFNTPGTYTITSTVFDGCSRTLTDRAIYTLSNPITATGSFCTTPGVTLNATGTNTGLFSNYVWFANATSTSPLGIGSTVGLNYGDISNMPTSFWVEAASAVSTGTSGINQSIGMAASGLTWPANTSPYGPLPFTVSPLTSVLTLKSFVIRPYSAIAGTIGTFTVTIRNASNTILFQRTFTGTAGSNFTVPINTDLTSGTYGITFTSATLGFWGGTWAGGTNAGQISLPTSGTAGTYGLANLIYDYKNFSYTPTCAIRTQVFQSCVVPTPIELLRFEGQYSGSGILLHWTTLSETNNDRFEIQRSSDGIHFYTIKTIKGRGNTSRVSEYSTVDPNPTSNLNYYRLLQVDFDGKQTMSKTISVRTTLDSEFIVAPNPSDHTFKITFTQEFSSAEISIIDMLGKTVAQLSTQNENSIEFGSDLPKGAYVVKVIQGSESNSRLIIKE